MKINKMYEFEITRIELKKNEFGKNDLLIKQVKVLKDGKYLKFAKLNDELVKALKKSGTIKIKNNETF